MRGRAWGRPAVLWLGVFGLVVGGGPRVPRAPTTARLCVLCPGSRAPARHCCTEFTCMMVCGQSLEASWCGAKHKDPVDECGTDATMGMWRSNE